jgi:HlyD family secretion protein
MSATVDILTKTRSNVVTVPVQAVTTRVVERRKRRTSHAGIIAGQDEKEEVVFRIVEGRARKGVCEERYSG